MDWALSCLMIFPRGTAAAAGLLVRSWDAGEEGGAAIVYDWERNWLEAIFQGDGDIVAQGDLDATPESQRRFGGSVEMRPKEQLKVCPYYINSPSSFWWSLILGPLGKLSIQC